MPKRWNDDQLSVMTDFFFDSHEDFGGDGNSPQFGGWDPFDWSDLLTKINSKGPLRTQGSLAGKWQNLASVHMQKTGREPESRFSDQDITAYENGRRKYEHRLKSFSQNTA